MRFISLLILFSFSICAKTQLFETENNEVIPSIDQRVIIPSSKLDENELDSLIRKVEKLERNHDVVLQIIAIENIEPLSINEAMLITLEKLPFGKEERDKQLLVLIAFEQREIKIHYGEALNFSSKFQKKLISKTIVPALKDNKVPEMVEAIVNVVAQNVEKPVSSHGLEVDIDWENFLKLKVPLEQTNYYIPLFIFLILFPLLLKVVKNNFLLIPLISSSIFSISAYIFYPTLELITLCFFIGLLLGSIRSLNSILFFLSNSDRGHKYKISSKKYSLWETKKEEIIGGGISGDLDD